MKDYAKTKSELIRELEECRRRIEELEASVANLLSEKIQARGMGKTIMVVDDEEEFRSSLGQLLESAGFRVHLAPGGEEALELLALEKGNVDLVILDMVMKGMGGTETFQRMRELKPDIPIIICTGNAFAAQDALTGPTERLLSRAGISFLQKPFVPDRLIAAIREKIE